MHLVIEPTSYPIKKGGFVPEVSIWEVKGESVTVIPFYWDRVEQVKEQADRNAVHSIVGWLKENYPAGTKVLYRNQVLAV